MESRVSLMSEKTKELSDLDAVTLSPEQPDTLASYRQLRSVGQAALGVSEYDPEAKLAWQSDSLCTQTGPEAFFPEKGGSTRDAKKICKSCEVRAQCLDYALENDERFGIWGGLSERERRKLRDKRKSNI